MPLLYVVFHFLYCSWFLVYFFLFFFPSTLLWKIKSNSPRSKDEASCIFEVSLYRFVGTVNPARGTDLPPQETESAPAFAAYLLLHVVLFFCLLYVCTVCSVKRERGRGPANAPCFVLQHWSQTSRVLTRSPHSHDPRIKVRGIRHYCRKLSKKTTTSKKQQPVGLTQCSTCLQPVFNLMRQPHIYIDLFFLFSFFSLVRVQNM